MSGVLITEGTSTNVATDLVGTTNYQKIKLDYGAAGASALFTGTILGVNSGTIDSTSQFPPNPWQANISVGTSTLGTIKPAVSGSAIFITDLVISAGTQTNLVIGMGGTSTPLMGTLSFAQYGGLVSNFKVPGSVTSGSALVYQQSANNTLSIYAAGFVR